MVSPFYDGLKTMLIAAPMLAFAAWLTLCWRRRALWLSYGIDVLDAELATVPLPVKLSQALFVGREFRDSAQRLRKHRYCPTRQLDVRKTVNATAARAGLFYPIYRERPQLPEYVFLIEQNGTNDHLARLFDLAIERLQSKDVFIQRYYFHTDPRQVQADDAARTLVSLADLVARTNDHPLIIIATADGFFHPLTGEVESWVHRLEPWRSRTMLSTRPLEQWTMAELRLLEEGFSLATAETSGFAAAGEKIAIGTEEPELLEGVVVMPAPLRQTAEEERQRREQEQAEVKPGVDLWAEPLATLRRIQDEINRAFGDQKWVPSAEFPPINVWRGPDGIVITAEIPGVNFDDVNLTVHQNTLTIKGRREPEAKEPEASFHRHERTFGPFTRTVALPSASMPIR